MKFYGLQSASVFSIPRPLIKLERYREIFPMIFTIWGLTCREILIEYSNQVMKLGKTLFLIFSETLGLEPSYLNDILHCNEGLQVLGHYYPACTQPQLTMGSPQHADNAFLTVLL
mgnify:CR=1 FL=1